MSEERQILVRTFGTGGPWSSPATTTYDDEAHLQSLLVKDPGRIPGVSDAASAVAELSTSGGPIDVCAIDVDGSITVVECKLASNSERHRMVIGQVLDYASAIWVGGIEAFRAAWSARGGADLDSSFTPDALRALEARIRDAQIHLCLAVDAIDDDLRRLIEYLNRITVSDVSVTALQLSYARHADLEILIPTTFGGEIADAKQRAAGGNPTPWTWESFFGALDDPGDRQLVQLFFKRLTSTDVRHGTNELVWFGSRPNGGIFLHPFGVKYSPIQLWVNAAGRFMVYGNWRQFLAVSGHPGFAQLAQLLGQEHTGSQRGVRADSVDFEELWAVTERCVLEVNGIDAEQP